MGVVLCVPFLTLYERKILSYVGKRKGPKKISLWGLLQPIVDGVKLIIKERGKTLWSKKIIFYFSPIAVFSLSLLSTIILSKGNKAWVFKLCILFFLVIISCKIFPLFFSGVRSKRKYARLGSFRGAAQVIAYEVKVVLIILFPTMLANTFRGYWILFKSKLTRVILPLVIVFWFFCIVSETNRAPFDFAEGERELVSGFKTEYSGLKFTFLFLAEYRRIVILRVLTSMIFFKKNHFFSLFFLYCFMALRATFPRFRYDFLMSFSWKVILVSALSLICLLFIVI